MTQDLFVMLKYMGVSELKRIGGEMFAPAAEAPQPGWYVRAHRNEGYDDVVQYTRVSAQDAHAIAEAIDGAIGGGCGNRVRAAVRVANNDHERERIRRKEAATRAKAAAVATLAAIEAEERR